MFNDDISLKELKENYTYNKDNGLFYCRKTGKAKTTKSKQIYIRIQINGKRVVAHRLAWLYVYGEYPKGMLDHKNQNIFDNRITNLQITDYSNNAKNQKQHRRNTSGTTGVSWHKGDKRWQASIVHNCKTIYLGNSKDKDVAIKLRKEAEKKYGYSKLHGRIAND